MEEVVDSSGDTTSLLAKGNQGKGGCLWIKFNVDQTGFYRVKYDDELAARLRYAIEANQLSATDRFGNMKIVQSYFLLFPMVFIMIILVIFYYRYSG